MKSQHIYLSMGVTWCNQMQRTIFFPSSFHSSHNAFFLEPKKDTQNLKKKKYKKRKKKMKKIYPAKQPHSYTNHTLKKHRMTDQNTDRQQRRLTQKRKQKHVLGKP